MSNTNKTVVEQENRKKDTLEILETYAINFKVEEPKRYERIPDVIDYLTYIDTIVDDESGAVSYERKRLTPIEKELYRIIKRAAGETLCYKTRDTLAWELNCSSGAITKAKKSLSQSFEQLDGKALIDIEERMVPSRDGDTLKNKKIQHYITINHVWNYNNAFMSIVRNIDYREKYKTGTLTEKEACIAIESLRQIEIVHKSQAKSPHDNAYEATSPHDTAPQRALSPADANHTNHQTPYDISYPPANASPNDFLEKQKIDDLMTKMGIYKTEQDRLRKIGGYTLLNHAIFKLKMENPKSNTGAYFVKIVESL